MSKAPSNFRKTDIIRAFDALRKAGIERPRIEYIFPNGAKIVFGVQPESPPTAPADTAVQNEWDGVA